MRLLNIRLGRLYILLLLCMGILIISGESNMIMAEEFTNASLTGTYSATSIGREGQLPIASIGIITFDGNEEIKGFLRQNQPGPLWGSREIVEIPFKGTYALDTHGTGTVTQDDGSESIFVITQAQSSSKGIKKAKKISLLVKDLNSDTGSLVTYTLSRLPNAGIFDQRSMKGTYVTTILGQGGKTPEAALGVGFFDGVGRNFNISNVNLPGTSFKDRIFFTISFEENYKVNEDGTGSTIMSDGTGGSIFVITKASVINEVKVAQEVFIIANNLSPTTGNLLAGVGKGLTK